MTYPIILSGIFISRPNRFIAHVNIDGKHETAHVKNTGRCKELLIPGATVYLECHNNPLRKTKYSLIAVQKNDLLINMDSQAPNKVWHEALENSISLSGINNISLIKREAVYGNSRLDFYVEGIDKGITQKAYMEVKGVTLEENNTAFFPDAPTERGVKHINELICASVEGYLAYIVFIIQMKGIRRFLPNDNMHPEFGNALRSACKNGVHILAYDCYISPNKIEIGDSVPVVI